MNPHLLSKSEVRVLRSSSELSNGLRRVVAGAVPFSMSRAPLRRKGACHTRRNYRPVGIRGVGDRGEGDAEYG